MKSARILALLVFLAGFAFNEWAFRFIFPLQPIDSFLRLMTLVLDAFWLTFVITFLGKNISFKSRVQDLLKSNAQLVAIYLGLFLSYCMIMTIEFSCRYYFKYVYQAPYSETTSWQPSAVTQDSILGSSLAKDTVISHSYVINDSLIYEQNYRTDEFGRRITPSNQTDTTTANFMMVTGCSFAFGYGLNERQTLSFYLDSLTKSTGYNYGISGHGTQQTLALLQNRNLASEIEEPNGVLVHLFIDDHLPRLIGSRRLIKLWAKHFPYFYLDGDELKRNGSFWTGRSLQTRFYKAISQSAFLDLFDIDFPWYISNAHMALFASVLETAQLEFLDQYPNGRFLVVIGPNSTLAPRVSKVLSEKGVEVIDLSKLLNKEDPTYKLHWTERHPNSKYYLEVAQAIKAHLNP